MTHTPSLTQLTAPRCQNKHWRTRERDCPHPARYVVRAIYDELLVCGVHRRGWIPRVVHPFGSPQLATPATRAFGL